MDFLNLIDTKSVASKYASFSDPIKMISMTLLRDPQTLLCAVLKSKNRLNVMVSDLANLITTIYSLKDSFSIFPKPITNLEGLDNIKLALTNSNLNVTIPSRIDDFLNSTLSHVKSSGDFLLNRNEAMQDIVVYISGINLLYSQINPLIDNIINSVSNIQSVDFSMAIKNDIKNTSVDTLSNIKNEINQTSPISVATEILGIKAAQAVLLDKIGVLDPFFDSLSSTDVLCSTENINAQALSSLFPITTASGNIDISVNGGAVQAHIFPSADVGVFGNVCVISTLNITSVNIPANSMLYLDIVMNGNPGPKQTIGYPKNIIPVPFIAGTTTVASIILAINNGMIIQDTTFVTRSFGRCTEFGPSGSGVLMIYGSSDVVEINLVPSIPGSFVLGTYTPPTTTSCHLLFGFTDFQKSFPSTQPNIDSVVRFINLSYTGISCSKTNDKISISSNSIAYDSSLLFSNMFSSSLGFPTSLITSLPSYISTFKNSEPFPINARPNFTITTNDKTYTITSVIDNKLFALNLDPQPLLPFKVMSDIQDIVPKLSFALSSVNLDIDINKLQRLSMPLFSPSYSIYQISDFYKYIDEINAQVVSIKNVLVNFPLDKSNSPSENTLASIVSFLESKGLDNMLDNIVNGEFITMLDVPSLSEGIMNNIEALANSVSVEVITNA